jgi:hypothetical protein
MPVLLTILSEFDLVQVQFDLVRITDSNFVRNTLLTKI